MAFKFNNILLVLILRTVLVIGCSTANNLETDKLADLTERFNEMKKKMEEEIKNLKVENAELKSDVKELKNQNAQQDNEIHLLKNQISDLKSLSSSKKFNNNNFNKMDHGTSVYNVPLNKVLSTPPSSCQELYDGNGLARPVDGIHLLKIDNKIQATFCIFPTRVSYDQVFQDFIGNVNLMTKSIYFYVQRSTPFNTSDAVIPFELAVLDEGDAFDLESGVFTAPVPGVYHFQVSAVKYGPGPYLWIILRKNDVNVGSALTDVNEGSFDSVSLSASLRLDKNDRVMLYNNGSGVVYDYLDHHTHFNGRLIEEDLM